MQYNAFYDTLILVPAVAFVLSVIIKGVTIKLSSGDWNLERSLGSGWMPSVHSSVVVSLATAFALKYGVHSDLFAIVMWFTVIIIYDAINEMKEAMEGLLSAKIEEKVIGTCEIRETFKITKVGTIAGCYVLDGIIKRNNKIRVIRDGVVQHTGTLGSLKRFKDDVKEVKNNYECGLNIERYNDIKEGDIVEAFEEVEVARKL